MPENGILLRREDLSLVSLGTSSIATMYRVTGAIKEHASSWSNPQQDLPTKTSPDDTSPEIVQEMNLELRQQPESRQPASAWLGPNVTEDQISDVPGSIVPRDHPLWPAIANTAVRTLDTIGSVLPRLIEAGLATYIWNKFLEGNFRNQHTTFHEQAEVKVGNHVLSQAAVLLQPLLLSRYNDCDKLGAFMEAVLVDLREHGPVQIPGEEGIRRDLLNLLAQLHRMSTVACSVKALYNSLDWRLTTRSYMALLLSLAQPDNLSGSSRLLAQRSEGPTPGQVPSGSGLVSAQLAEGPTSAQMSSGSNPYADLQQPGALANQGMDSVPGNRAKPFNQYALSVWSCVIGNHVFAEAVVGSALPCCCTYFRPAVPSPNPLPLMSPDGYPAESQVELKPQVGRVPSDCRPGPSGAKRTAAAMVWGPCPHYQKGFCRYGDLCRYQHVVQFTPTQPTTTRDWSAALPFSGTQVCPHFQRGFCKRGQACGFAHLQPEHECLSHEAFNNGKTLPTAPPRIRRPPLCAEARQELQSWNLLRECFKFHMGHCSQNKCGFQHSDLVPERRVILMKWIAPHAGAVSKENKEQEVSRPEGASGSQDPHWQWDPREAISLQDHMVRESQDVPAASRKFTAPRPERHFQKGVKVSKLGSTILKCVSGASQRIVERGSVDRPKSSQPCVFAPPDACKPVVPRVLVKQSRCNKAGTVLRHFAKPTGIKRRTQIPNAPGTRMRAVKPQCVSQLSPVAARVPWADLQDSDEEEPPDSNSSPEEDMSARFGTSFSVPLRNQRELGDPAPVDCPSARFQRPDTQDVLTEANQAAHQGEHKPNKGRSSTLDKLPAEPGHGSPSAVPFGSSSEVRVSGSGELKLSSMPVHIQGDSDGPCPMWANPFEVKVRGRSPTLRLGFSPKPVQHHKVRSQCKSVSPESCRCSSQPGKISSLHLTRPPGSRASSLPPPGLLVHKGGSSLLEGFECPAEAGGGDSPGRKEKGNLSCKEAFPCKNLADEVSAEKQRPRVDDKRSKSVPEQVGGEPEGGSRSIHRRDLDHSGEPEGGSKSIHRRDLDHSVLNYDMTLGYPGEGPVPGPKTPPKGPVSGPKTPPKEMMPRTPPKDARPRTPPKSKRLTPPKGPPPADSSPVAPIRGSSSSGSIPPWTQDLEEEVRGLSREYLARSSGNVVASATESRRTLVPPKAKVSRPSPPVPPPPRARAKSEAIAQPSKGIVTPEPAKAFQPPPPPKPRDRQEEVTEPRVVKAKFDSGFSYQDARKQAAASTSSMGASYAHTSGLPDIRPLVPFNPAGHLNQQVKEATEVSKGASPTVIPEKTRGYARPTPKVKTARSPDSGPVGIESSQAVGSSTELACINEGTGNSAPSGPERGPETDLQDPTPVDVSQSTDKETILVPSGTGELSSSSSDLEVRSSLKGVSGGSNRPEPADPKVPYPVGKGESVMVNRPEPADPKVPYPVGKGESVMVSRPEPTDPKVPRSLGEERTVGGSRLESADHRAAQAPDRSSDNKISYEVTIKVLANPDHQRTRLLTLSSTHAGLFCNQLIVHGTRRVLEVLLMAWRSGYRLGELTRFIRFGEENEFRVPICVRDLFDRVVIDSTILARFETDSQGAAIQIRYGLLKSLLSHPQTLEAERRHCDPLRPANLFIEPPSENAGFMFNLQLEARFYATKTFVRDAPQEASCQAYPAVALCSTLTHWMRMPNVHRIREGWALVVWPVPLQELRAQEETG